MGVACARIRATARSTARRWATGSVIAAGAGALAWLFVSGGLAKADPAGDGQLSLRPSSVSTASHHAQADKPKSTKPDAAQRQPSRPAEQPGADALLHEAIEFQKRGIDAAAGDVHDLNERRKALELPPRHDN